ncbi:hypothetical protein G9A89_016005 [Geosiphon pyriformis]|nr:hypothetical protein G9A89_016005 [Geosiphon pyriformis]
MKKSCFLSVTKLKKTIIIGNEWLKKVKTLLNYELCELTIRCGKKLIVVKCCHWTTPPVPKQNQEEKQSNESNDNESDDEKNQEEQKKTAKLIYTIVMSWSNKLIDNKREQNCKITREFKGRRIVCTVNK